MLAAALLEQELDGLEIFNPITNPFNDKSTLPKATDIFEGDYRVIRDLTKHFIVNLDNPLDSGVMMELGQVLQMIENGEDIEVYPVLSDIRIGTAGEYSDVNIPWGYNQYVIGALEYYGIHIYGSFDAALLGLVVRAQYDDNIYPQTLTVYGLLSKYESDERVTIYRMGQRVYDGRVGDMTDNSIGHAIIDKYKANYDIHTEVDIVIK